MTKERYDYLKRNIKASMIRCRMPGCDRCPGRNEGHLICTLMAQYKWNGDDDQDIERILQELILKELKVRKS